jgi:pSer/pThr/pTyr-binding forkhead associated (FHA) protein
MTGIVVLIFRILMTALLFAFIGWALWNIWKDLRAQGTLLSAPNIPRLTFAPLDGIGETLTFQAPEVMIGRSTGCELCLPDETVSSRHARLSYHQSQWWVEDVQSTNGTFLNDERISVPTVITSGDELRLGQVRYLVAIEEKIRI